MSSQEQPVITLEDTKAVREIMDAEVDQLAGQLAPLFDGQSGPVIFACLCDSILTVAAQDHEARGAIALKLRCLQSMVEHMPAGPLDLDALCGYLESPECEAMQERILQEAGGSRGQ